MPIRYFALCLLFVGSALNARAQAPVAAADSFFVEPGMTLEISASGVLSNDVDAEGDSLRAVLVDAPEHGSLSLNADGTFSYTPEPGFEGPDFFWYRAVTIPLQNLTVDESGSQVEFGATISNSLLGTDNDSETINLAGTAQAEIFPAGSLVDSIQVRALSLRNLGPLGLTFDFGSPVALLTLNIDAPADSITIDLSQRGPISPVFAPFSIFDQTGNKIDVSADIELSASGTLAGLVPGGPQDLRTETDWDILQGGVTIKNGIVTLVIPVTLAQTVDLDGNAVDLDITGAVVASGPLSVVEESGNTLVRIQVGEAVQNAPPLIVSSPAVIDVRVGGSAYESDISTWFVDPDGDTITYTVEDDPSLIVAVDLMETALSISGIAEGTTLVTVTADDGRGGVTQVFTEVNVLGNSPPRAQVAVPEMAFIEGDDEWTVDLNAWFEDPDGDAMSFEATSEDDAVVSVAVSGELLTVSPGTPGLASISVIATDIVGTQGSTSVLVTVNANTEPVADGAPAFLEFDLDEGPLTYDLSAWFTDADGHALTYALSVSDSTVVSAALAGSELVLTPRSSGSATLVATADDSRGGTAQAPVTLSVFRNDPPVALSDPDPVELLVGGAPASLDLSGYFEDPDGDAITLSISAWDNSVIDAVLDGTVVTITAVSVGSTAVEVTASDTRGELASAMVLVDVPSGVAVDEQADLPFASTLGHAFPNPVQDVARISFSMEKAGAVNLSLFDLLGRRLELVLSGSFAPGQHEAAWSMQGFASGMYLLRLELEGQSFTRTVLKK